MELIIVVIGFFIAVAIMRWIFRLDVMAESQQKIAEQLEELNKILKDRN